MAPRGNPKPTGSKPDKLMRDALRIAINREGVDADGRPTKKLHLIAEKLVDKAVDGEAWAVSEVFDRIDGRAHQTAELVIDDKREASDWTRADLVSILSDARNGSTGTPAEVRRLGEPDKVH